MSQVTEQFERTTATIDLTIKISYIFTDNVANMLKAFSLPGFEVMAVPDTISGDSSDGDDDDGNAIPTVVLDSSLLDNVSEHVSCFAYTLELVKDGFKHAAAISKVLAKTAAIVFHMCKSTLPMPHDGIPSCPWSGQYSEFRRTWSVLWIHNTSLLCMTRTF